MDEGVTKVIEVSVKILAVNSGQRKIGQRIPSSKDFVGDSTMDDVGLPVYILEKGMGTDKRNERVHVTRKTGILIIIFTLDVVCVKNVVLGVLHYDVIILN